MAFPKTLKPSTVARMEADMARHSAERFQTACDLVMGHGDPVIWASSVLGFMRRAGIVYANQFCGECGARIEKNSSSL